MVTYSRLPSLTALPLNIAVAAGSVACKTKLVSGAVTYPNGHSAMIAEHELLLCCAEPAAVEGGLISKVSIKL